MDHAYFLAPFLLPFPKKEEVNERKKRMISSVFLPSSCSPPLPKKEIMWKRKRGNETEKGRDGRMKVSSFCVLSAPSFRILKKEKQAYKIKKGDSFLLLLSSFSKRTGKRKREMREFPIFLKKNKNSYSKTLFPIFFFHT